MQLDAMDRRSGLATLAFCLVATTFACTSTIPVWEHEPTAGFARSHDLSDPKLAPFFASGVLVTAAFVQGRPMVKVRLYSDKETDVLFQSLVLSGVGAKSGTSHTVSVNESTTLTKSAKGEIFRGYREVRLPMAGEAFDELGAEGFALVLTLRVGAEGPDESVTLDIGRRSKTVPTCGGW